MNMIELNQLKEFWKALSNGIKKVPLIEKDLLQDVLKDLLLRILKKIQMTPEEFQDQEDGEDLKEKYKETDICEDILKSIQKIMGFDFTFGLILQYFEEGEEEENTNQILKAECASLVLTICINSIPQDQNHSFSKWSPRLSKIVKEIFKINPSSSSNIEYTKTKMALIRSIAKQKGFILDGNTTKELLLLVIESLEEPELEKDAMKTLKISAENWSAFILNNIDSLTNSITNEKKLIVSIIATLASGKSLVELCKPVLASLKQNIDDKDQTEIEENLGTLQTIFYEAHSSNSTTHQLHLVFQDLWPLFKQLFNLYSEGNDDILIRLCKIMKKAIRIIETEFQAHYLNEFLEIASGILKQNPCGEVLYCVENSVSAFGQTINIEKITEIYLTTSQRISSGEESEEFMEDFFGLLFRCAKHIPSIFATSFGVLDRNLAILVENLETENFKLFKSLLYFLEQFLNLCSDNPQNDHEKRMTEIYVGKYGETTTKKLMQNLHDKKRRELTLESFYFGLIAFKKNELEWLEVALEEVEVITDDEEKKLMEVLKEINFDSVNKKKNQNPVNEEERQEIIEQYFQAFELLQERFDD